MGQTEVVIGAPQADLLRRTCAGLGKAEYLAPQCREVHPQGQVDSLNEGGVDRVGGAPQERRDGLRTPEHDVLGDRHDASSHAMLDHLSILQFWEGFPAWGRTATPLEAAWHGDPVPKVSHQRRGIQGPLVAQEQRYHTRCQRQHDGMDEQLGIQHAAVSHNGGEEQLAERVNGCPHLQVVDQIVRHRLHLLRCLRQTRLDRVGVYSQDARSGLEGDAFRQRRDDLAQALGCHPAAVKERPGAFGKMLATHGAAQLPPAATVRVTVGDEVAQPDPAVV